MGKLTVSGESRFRKLFATDAELLWVSEPFSSMPQRPVEKPWELQH